MATKDENDNLMINTDLLKIVGFYQFLSPHSPRVFDYNVFKCIAVVQVLIINLSAIEFVLNIYYCWGDVNEVTKYTMYLQSDVIAMTKAYYVFRYADEIWRCIQATSVDRLRYKYHGTSTLQSGRDRLRSLSILVMILWTGLVGVWIVAPFLAQDYFIPVLQDDGETVYHYRFNSLNCLFPVSDVFYNRHFFAYYCVESTVLIVWGHARMIFDVLVTSMCITISYQLKTIADSFRMFNVAHAHLTNNVTKTAEHKESELLFDFKDLIEDQQKVIENMKNIYRVFRPVIIIQLALDSLTTISLSSISIMNYFSGVPLVSLMNLKQLLSMSSYIIRMFFMCYLFADNNEQKDSLNFGMYSSGWTENSLYFRQLILFSMRMNNSENLKLKASQRKIVNFELFKDIMQTTYSISSLLVNQCAKKP